MKVILLADVKSVGKKGETVTVADGYGRNVLIAKKLGVEATAQNMNNLKLQKANEDKIAQEQLQAAKDLAQVLETKQVVIKVKAGEGGRMFGSVSSKEIVAEFKKQHNMELDKKKIVLADAIKAFGNYEVAIKLHPQVTGKFTVKVTEA